MTMGTLFLVVIVGYGWGKTFRNTHETAKGLSDMIVNITSPALVIASTMGDTMPDRRLILPLLIIGFVTYALLLLLARVLPKLLGLSGPNEGLFSFMMAFGNVGFIGYPVVASIFGPEAVFYASVLNVANTVTVFVWGAQFIAGKEAGGSILKRLYSPGLIGTYVSILIVAVQWHAPAIISQACTLVGNITVPGSLLIIGHSMAHIPLKHMAGDVKVFTMAPFRLIVLPLFVWCVFQALNMLPFIHIDETVLAINTILIAMPVATFGTIFCLKYGRDDTLMAQGTFLTTILAMLSIPLVAGVIG